MFYCIKLKWVGRFAGLRGITLLLKVNYAVLSVSVCVCVSVHVCVCVYVWGGVCYIISGMRGLSYIIPKKGVFPTCISATLNKGVYWIEPTHTLVIWEYPCPGKTQTCVRKSIWEKTCCCPVLVLAYMTCRLCWHHKTIKRHRWPTIWIWTWLGLGLEVPTLGVQHLWPTMGREDVEQWNAIVGIARR